jgi:hypothetical protein
MKIKLLAISLLLAGGLTATSVSAQDFNGFFLQGKLGSASASDDNFDDDVTSFEFNGGYRWGVFGIEGGYTDFGDFEGFDSGLDLDGNLSGWTLGGNFRTAFADGWYFGGRAGAFFWDGDADFVLCVNPSPPGTCSVVQGDIDGTDFYAGVSVGYDFNPQFSLGLAYDYYGAEDGDVDLGANVISLVGEVRF